MTTLAFETHRSRDINLAGLARRTIARIVEAWKQSRRYDKASLRKWTFVEQNLTDPNVGMEIARTLR